MIGRVLRLPAACGLALVMAGAAAGDWPQFRGPNGSAVSDEPGLPVRWSATENVRWKAALPGYGVSCPVVVGGRVYLTCCTGYQESRLHVLCFDSATGKQLWDRQFHVTGNTLCHPKTSMAGPTPVTDGEHVYALFATGDLVCLDKDGDLVWYRSLVGDYPNVTNQVGMAASPILCKEVLLLPLENAGDSFAAGLDKRTGKNLWKVPRGRGINWVTPALYERGGRTEVLFQTGGEITAYDPQTGKQQWTHAGGLSGVASPFVAGGNVLVSSGGVLALRVAAGAKAPEQVWESNRLRGGYTTPVCYRGRVYAINSSGVLACVDAADGQRVWEERLKGLKGPFWASPIAGDGKVYVVDDNGVAAVVQVGDQPKVLSVNALGESVVATPAIAEGALFIRTDKHLYSIGERRDGR